MKTFKDVWNFAEEVVNLPIQDRPFKFLAESARRLEALVTVGINGAGWLGSNGTEPFYGVAAVDLGSGGTIEVPVPADAQKVIVRFVQNADKIFGNPATVKVPGLKLIGTLTEDVAFHAPSHFQRHSVVFSKDEFTEGNVSKVILTADPRTTLITRLTVEVFQ